MNQTGTAPLARVALNESAPLVVALAELSSCVQHSQASSARFYSPVNEHCCLASLLFSVLFLRFSICPLIVFDRLWTCQSNHRHTLQQSIRPSVSVKPQTCCLLVHWPSIVADVWYVLLLTNLLTSNVNNFTFLFRLSAIITSSGQALSVPSCPGSTLDHVMPR